MAWTLHWSFMNGSLVHELIWIMNSNTEHGEGSDECNVYGEVDHQLSENPRHCITQGEAGEAVVTKLENISKDYI